MKLRLKQYQAKDLWQILRNLGLIALGSVLCAIAIKGILIPREFFSAGFVGLALVIYYFFPALPVAWLYFLLNVPLFAIGWRFVGRRFLLYSVLHNGVKADGRVVNANPHVFAVEGATAGVAVFHSRKRGDRRTRCRALVYSFVISVRASYP